MYKVYYLPNCNYCGVTGRSIEKRLWEHRYYYSRNTDNVKILAEFNNKKEAYDFERKYQVTNNTKGNPFTENYKKIKRELLLNNPMHIDRQIKVVCVETNEVFESVSKCAKFHNSSKGNLIKHLKGNENHKTFRKLKFKYYE